MPKSRTASRSEAGYHVFIGLSAVLFLLGKDSPLAIALYLSLMIWLFVEHRKLFVWGLILCFILAVRFYQKSEPFPIVDHIELQGTVTDVADTSFRLRASGKSYLVYSGRDTLNPGDLVKVLGRLGMPDLKNNLHNFDYASYLRSDGVDGILYSYFVEVKGNTFHGNQIKVGFDRYLRQTFGESTYPYVRLIVLGSDDSIEDATASAIRTMGISHIFAISGMHLGILLGFLHTFYRKLFVRIDRYVWLDGLFLVLYNLVTGWQVSLLRASLLAIVVAIKPLSKHYSKIDSVTWILIVFLLFNPFLLDQIGFQLSFLISYAILFASNLLKGLKGIRSDLAVTLIANLVSLPIVLETNKEIAIFILVYNLIFVFLVGKILMPATFLVCLLPTFQTVFRWLTTTFEWLITAASKTAFVFRINLGGPLFVMLYWVVLFSLFGRIETKKRFVNQAICLFLILITSSFIGEFPMLSSVTVLDVNQGDATFIEGRNCRMLIDTGEPDDYDSLIQYLRGNNVYRLDYVVITHNHDDHFGELSDLDRTFEIGKIIAAKAPPVSVETPIMILDADDRFSCGNFDFTVLSADTLSNEENNNSLVLLGEIGGENWLFTGDAEEMVESAILSRIDRPIAGLKIGHHGSLTSSSAAFLDQCQPLFATISVGNPNAFGHPDQAILDRFEERKINLYRTDQDGMMTFQYLPWFDIVVMTSRNQADFRAFFWNRIRSIRQINGTAFSIS